MRLWLLVALASWAALQTGQNQPPVFRSGTDVVRFDVRVTGADGRPIKDLTPGELEIVEDGKPRPILLFQHIEEPAAAYGEAEPFLLQEIRTFPNNTRARSSLAMLYRAMGRTAESDRAIDEMLRASPTAETRAMAVKLWTMFGEPAKAQRVRIP